MIGKKKIIRFLPLLGGIIAIIVCFIAYIPLGPSFSLQLHILETSGIYYYVWGVVEDGSIWFNYSQVSVDNLIPLILWILFLFSAICGLIGASYKEKPTIIKKLLLIGGLIIATEFLYFTLLVLINIGKTTIGLGYYGLIIIMFLYFLSAGLVSDFQK